MKQYKGLDLGKIIMAIFVIAIHTHPLENVSNVFIMNIYNFLVHSAVPFFFICSGFFLFRKSNSDEKIKKYLMKTIKLYCLWNIIFLPISIYDYVHKGYSIFYSLLDYIRGFFIVGEHFYSWPLWYLLSLIYSIALIFFLKKLKIDNVKILLISIFLFFIGTSITYLTDNYNNFSGIIYHVSYLLNYVLGSGRIFTGIMYIAIGMCLSIYNPKIIKKGLLLLLINIFICSIFINNIILQVIFNIGLFVLFCDLNLPSNKIYGLLRKTSTIMYFTHMIFFFIYSLGLGFKNNYGIVGFSITLFCSVVLSFLIIKSQEKANLKILSIMFQ